VENRIILIGLDLGTQGVRAIAASEKGGVLAEASRRYETINTAKDPWKEQDAAGWRRAAFAVLAELSAALRAKGLAGRTVLSLDGTSGTVVPLDKERRAAAQRHFVQRQPRGLGARARARKDRRAGGKARLSHGRVLRPAEDRLAAGERARGV
jgi:sugar (pentulose or hexulose) kinase